MGNDINVIVVDDDDLNLEIIEEYVDGEGYSTKTFTNGISAWEYLNSSPNEVDVILLDKMMPHMNGLQLVEKMKSDIRLRDIPIIMISADDREKDIYESQKKGLFRYIVKPFEREVLLTSLESATNHVKGQDVAQSDF